VINTAESFQADTLRRIAGQYISNFPTRNSTTLTALREKIRGSTSVRKSTTMNSPHERIENVSQRHFTPQNVSPEKILNIRLKEPPPSRLKRSERERRVLVRNGGKTASEQSKSLPIGLTFGAGVTVCRLASTSWPNRNRRTCWRRRRSRCCSSLSGDKCDFCQQQNEPVHSGVRGWQMAIIVVVVVVVYVLFAAQTVYRLPPVIAACTYHRRDPFRTEMNSGREIILRS